MTSGPLTVWYTTGPLPPLSDRHIALLPWDLANLAAAKAAGYKALAYQNASGCNSDSQNSICPSGVSYQEALNSGWLLLNTAQQFFTFNNQPTRWAADIGDPNYARGWACYVIGLLAANPWDGVFIDDVNPTITGHYIQANVAKYPTDTLYGAAMGSFIATVGPLIQAAGKLAIANISQTAKYAATTAPWRANVSGVMDEQLSPGKLYIVT